MPRRDLRISLVSSGDLAHISRQANAGVADAGRRKSEEYPAMSNPDRNAAARYGSVSRSSAGEIDQGLRAYMLRVYNYMAIGLALTGVFAYGLASYLTTSNPAEGVANLGGGLFLTQMGLTVYTSPLQWVLMLAPLALVFALSFGINRMSVGMAQGLFWLYSALVGMSLSSIFIVYTQESITQVFFITAATFGALSLYGYTTQRDLSGMGSFLFMGLVGIILASIVNIWLASSALTFAVSVIGVLVFAGLTAYDTQQIKEMYFEGDDQASAGRKAVMGALRLYLDFINMFMMLLRLFGTSRE
jgi:FtsH-binding integral membrane protein